MATSTKEGSARVFEPKANSRIRAQSDTAPYRALRKFVGTFLVVAPIGGTTGLKGVVERDAWYPAIFRSVLDTKEIATSQVISEYLPNIPTGEKTLHN